MSNNYIKNSLQPYRKGFNDTENLIADYFIKLDQDVINKTLSNLSHEIGVSESTIFKFVKKIGFQGFQHFKISVASNYKLHNDADEKINVFSDITENDSLTEISQKVIIPKIGLLEYLLKSIEYDKIEEAVKLIHESKLIMFAGLGGSSIIAYDSYHKFLRTQFHCQYLTDFHIQLTYAKKMNSSGLALLFSHSGDSKEIVEIASRLKDNGVKIISLTGNYGTELERLSDVCFVVSSEDSALRSETLTSRILYMTIIDILYVIIMYRDKMYNEKSLDAYK